MANDIQQIWKALADIRVKIEALEKLSADERSTAGVIEEVLNRVERLEHVIVAKVEAALTIGDPHESQRTLPGPVGFYRDGERKHLALVMSSQIKREGFPPRFTLAVFFDHGGQNQRLEFIRDVREGDDHGEFYR